VLVEPSTKQRPRNVDLMNDWQYVERSIHRLLAAWGRDVAEWENKSALHRHIWDQAECVRRLRERIEQFPGGKADAPVSARLEQLANAVLLAPSLQDALDGIYELLLKTLVGAYGEYIGLVHPIHDAPTIALLHEINQIKSQQWLWYRDYRRRVPHTTDAAYRARVTALLEDCGQFRAPLPVTPGAEAQPAGVATDFRLSKFSARNVPIRPRQPFMDYVRRRLRHQPRGAPPLLGLRLHAREEPARRPVALALLRPLHAVGVAAHHLPPPVGRIPPRRLGLLAPARLRHQPGGCRLLRLRPAGARRRAEQDQAAQRGLTLDEAYARQQELLAPFKAEPLTKAQLYEHVFMIGLVAETGHFVVKNEGYVDFKEGQDLQSPR
jgi:hypothetical protein